MYFFCCLVKDSKIDLLDGASTVKKKLNKVSYETCLLNFPAMHLHYGKQVYFLSSKCLYGLKFVRGMRRDKKISQGEGARLSVDVHYHVLLCRTCHR